MIDDIELFFREADVLAEILTEYDQATGRLCSTDISGEISTDVIDEIEDILTDREELKQKSASSLAVLFSLIDGLGEDKAEFIRALFKGGEVKAVLNKEESKLKWSVDNLLSLQKSIMKKDSEFTARFERKYSETREALRELRGDKRKIDFLNKTAAPDNVDFGFKA